jgi:hypothetical protein
MREYYADMGVNTGCSINEVAYFVDDDPTQAKCGQCTPGTSGFFGLERTCEVNQFCADNGTCVNIRKHELFGKPCPYDSGVRGSVNAFCGPGLRCIQHKCLPCENGEIDMDTGMMCVNNEFTNNPYQKLLYDPTSMILFAMSLAYICYQILIGSCCAVRDIARWKKKRDKKNKELMQEEEGEQLENTDEELMEVDHAGGYTDSQMDQPDSYDDISYNDEDLEQYEGQIFEDENGREYTVKNRKIVYVDELPLDDQPIRYQKRTRNYPKKLPMLPM